MALEDESALARADDRAATAATSTPMGALPAELAAKDTHLRSLVRALDSVLVAFSGGVDSALLLKISVQELGARAVGALATSPAYDEDETAAALALAGRIGARVVVLQTHELDDPRYTANGADRCYFCKQELFGQLDPLRRALGLAHLAYGMNCDDRGDWRPGQQSAREHGVRAPLDEAGLGKSEIRALAHALDLPVWDKPAAACYSSRIPYGTPVTVETLRQIGRAERALRALGLRQVRVRHHDQLARIELAPDELARVLDPTLREQVVSSVRAAGYLYVTLDLLGYRTGSLNEALLRRRDTGTAAE